ncbi:MAG: helix-turn-helix domain-containing protein [Methyloprofundus sp.]|nr:helix-turn-helix domain-containing protein [Methyloprofundus sp.]
MSEQTTLPLIRASFLEPFYLLAKDIGSPVETILQSLYLPAQLPNEKELLLPEAPCWKFVQTIAKSEGYALYGLEATERSPWTELTTMQPLFKDCANLYMLLKRLIYFAPLQSKTSIFTLEEEEDFIWLTNRSHCLLPGQDCSQIMASTLLGMIQLIRAAAGSKWTPTHIHLTTKHSPEIEYAEQLNPSKMLFSQPVMKFSIPRFLLALPLSNFSHNKDKNIQDYDSYASIPDSFVNQLAVSLIPYLGMSSLNKKLIANIVELSPRTLQRRLEQSSSSYSNILAQARFMHAQTLLKTPSISMMEITLMLGYQNASSFTRAFHRWSGMNPKQFQLYFQSST